MKVRSLFTSFLKNRFSPGVALTLALSFNVFAQSGICPCFAQNQNLEQLLDKVDPAGAVSLPAVNNIGSTTANLPACSATATAGFVPVSPVAVSPAPVSPLQRAMQFFGPNANGQSMPQQQLQSQSQQQMGGGRPGLLKTLFGPDMSGAADGSDNMYRAENQASLARGACSRSYYGDYYTRSQAADEAYYAAEEARREADAASAKAASGVGNGQSNASAARSYAEAARASANTARANADRAWK